MKRQLETIARDISNLRTEIKNTETSIADARLGIKVDLIQTYVNDIDGIYDQYMGALKALMDTAYQEEKQ